MTEFERLFLDHREFVFRYLLKLSGDSSLAEELTQEAFFRAYMNLPRLRDREKAPAWLCSIARNAYFSWYNGQKKLSPLEEVPAETGTPEETLLAAEDARRLLACLAALEEPYRTVFLLSALSGLSRKEISRLYGKSESWARVTYYRAKQKLLERMA